MTEIAHSLRLDGDDASELILDIQRCLGIRFDRAELSRIETLGDLQAATLAQLDEDWSQGTRCLEAMTFYRLRRALEEMGTARATPSLDLTVIARPGPFLSELGRRSGMIMPRPGQGRTSQIGLVIFFLVPWLAAVPRLAGFPVPIWLLGVILAAGMILFVRGKRRIPAQYGRLGDLTRQVAVLNATQLAKGGARIGSTEVWRLVLRLVSRFSEVPSDRLGVETRLVTA